MYIGKGAQVAVAHKEEHTHDTDKCQSHGEKKAKPQEPIRWGSVVHVEAATPPRNVHEHPRA
jgi:hypothetical protein